MPSISLITYCKGRHREAEQYVPAALAALGVGDELVFVDYDDPDGVGSWVCSLGDERLTVVGVSGLPFFHVNHARNLGFRAAVGDIVVFSDVDFLVSPALISEVRALPVQSYLVQPDAVHSFGFVACLRSDVVELCGWDEAFVGYGSDDMHFREALRSIPRACFVMKNWLVPVQRTGEQVRIFGASIGILAAYNSRLSRALRMMHRYKRNISRNWGWGGVVRCRSRLSEEVSDVANHADVGW